jgi:hypothetical protein
MTLPPLPVHPGLSLPSFTTWQFFGTTLQPFTPQVVIPPWTTVPTGSDRVSTTVLLLPHCGCCVGCCDGRDGAGALPTQLIPSACWPFGKVETGSDVVDVQKKLLRRKFILQPVLPGISRHSSAKAAANLKFDSIEIEQKRRPGRCHGGRERRS